MLRLGVWLVGGEGGGRGLTLDFSGEMEGAGMGAGVGAGGGAAAGGVGGGAAARGAVAKAASSCELRSRRSRAHTRRRSQMIEFRCRQLIRRRHKFHCLSCRRNCCVCSRRRTFAAVDWGVAKAVAVNAAAVNAAAKAVKAAARAAVARAAATEAAATVVGFQPAAAAYSACQRGPTSDGPSWTRQRRC